MDQVPTELLYTTTHEWLRRESDGSVVVGITDHAQALLGEMVFVELPSVDRPVEAGSEIAVVESVKAASDVYAPIAGKLIAINEALQQTPALVNQDPYGAGWLCRILPNASIDQSVLLSADAYSQQIIAEV